MAEQVRIVPTEDGPNKVTGDFTLQWPSGHAIKAGNSIVLCRCGHSNDKPFCDGSHVRVGFKSREGDETAHRD
jgi:CDGSH-type Zn-finger protein